MKALDIVKTPKGNIAFVTETNNNGKRASINFIGNAKEHNAWWDESELEVIDSIPRMLAMALYHPFGDGKKDVEIFFKTT